ncbi:MAG: hypothetical protein KOO62_10680 [candidate division Zixibacteria bacterium]|nr:hypothetical protein [candidate division Zixibacteria bacterium]
MLNKLFPLIALIGLLLVAGCEDDEKVYDPAPEPPQGVLSITGDGEVTIEWMGPYDRDIDEFIVYRNSEAIDAQYTEIGRVAAVADAGVHLDIYTYVDDEVTNGITYFYAVGSVDHAGQVSDLSAEDVFDTPRPEGIEFLEDIFTDTLDAGFNFESQSVISALSSLCDIYVDSYEGIMYFNAGQIGDPRETVIQDMGYTGHWDDIGWAPTIGWSELGYVEVIRNHTYVICTDDTTYAKVLVKAIDGGAGVTFQWAHQEVPGNPELTAPNGNTDISNNDKSDVSLQ